jgi:hypothetical protein
MPLILALLLSAFPSTQQTSWMRLESFRHSIGMSRVQAMSELKSWNPKPGSTQDEVVVDYSGDKALTLLFRNERLYSARFELFVMLPAIRQAFAEEREYLRSAHGKPRVSSASVLVYDTELPNLMVVMQDDPKSEQGKKGVGVLAVRYYDPR